MAVPRGLVVVLALLLGCAVGGHAAGAGRPAGTGRHAFVADGRAPLHAGYSAAGSLMPRLRGGSNFDLDEQCNLDPMSLAGVGIGFKKDKVALACLRLPAARLFPRSDACQRFLAGSRHGRRVCGAAASAPGPEAPRLTRCGACRWGTTWLCRWPRAGPRRRAGRCWRATSCSKWMRRQWPRSRQQRSSRLCAAPRARKSTCSCSAARRCAHTCAHAVSAAPSCLS